MTSQLVHDLRTFLTVVYCTGQLIQDESRCGSALYYTEQILKSCESVDRLLKEILSISQAEMGNLPVRMQYLSLVDELTSAAQAHKLHAKRKGLALSLRFEGPFPRLVRTDGLRLRQIVSNLVGNAIKFTSAGKVEVICGYDEDELSITVTDTGIGIPLAEQAKIFDPYRKLRRSEKFPDSHGLGLPMAQRLARLMGGDVRVLRSKPGVGSSFRTTIVAPALESHTRKEDLVYAGIVQCT